MTHYPCATPGHELAPLDTLRPSQRNKIYPHKVERLARAMKAGSQFDPIDIDEAGNIIDGNHRYLASVVVDHSHIPVRRHIAPFRPGAALDEHGRVIGGNTCFPFAPIHYQAQRRKLCM